MSTTPLPFSSLTAVSPVDGRYADKTATLREYFSEYGLIKRRVIVMVGWLVQLSESGFIAQLQPFDAASRARLDAIAQNVTIANAERVKEIERTTNHDLKAVEYYIKEARSRLNTPVNPRPGPALALALSVTPTPKPSPDPDPKACP